MKALGVPFRVIPARIEEVPRPGEAPARFAARAALEKGEEVAAGRPSSWVLSADTIVVLDGEILGKPGGRAEAVRMLSRLAGREHVVHTAVCLIRSDRGYVRRARETTRVRFRDLSRREIAGYLRTGEPFDKAGAYAAQGAGSLLIARIAGSFTNVVGLPMTLVLGMLLRAGVVGVGDSGRGWYALAGVDE